MVYISFSTLEKNKDKQNLPSSGFQQLNMMCVLKEESRKAEGKQEHYSSEK